VPEEVFGIRKWECEVVSNYNVATFIKEFVVRLPEGEHLDFQPGGYIQIDVPPVVVDFKHARTVRLGWKLQVVAYGMLVEKVLGYSVPEGYIYLTRIRKAQKVVLRPSLRRRVMAIQEAMRAMLEQDRWPDGPDGRGPCVACEYRRFCNDRF